MMIRNTSRPRQRNHVLICTVLTVLVLAVQYMRLDEDQDVVAVPTLVSNGEAENESSIGKLSEGGFEVKAGVVLMSNPTEDLPYYHCGPVYGTSGPGNGSSGPELLMLHGAAYTKEDWKESTILEKLCRGNEELSVTALDLSVRADGLRLNDAFTALVEYRSADGSGGILIGSPVSVVSPSASGAALVHLGTLAAEGAASEASPEEADTDVIEKGKLLTRIVKRWIPVASGSVLQASDDSIKAYLLKSIPILAIHGTRDSKGKLVTERLVDLADATAVELDGGHPCYLDSPDEFVVKVLEVV